MNLNLDELFKRSHIVVILLGVVIFLVAAIGSFPVNGQTLRVIDPVWRYSMAILGLILISIGVYVFWREHNLSKEKLDEKLQRFTADQETLQSFRGLTEKETRPLIRRPPVFEDQRRRKRFPKYGKVHISSDPIAALEIISGPLQGAWLLLTIETGKVIFGRGNGPDISLHDTEYVDEQISRKHFAVSVAVNEENGHHIFRAIDLDSTNRTYINGAQLSPYTSCELTHGDEIWAGDTIVVFYLLALKTQPQAKNHQKASDS